MTFRKVVEAAWQALHELVLELGVPLAAKEIHQGHRTLQLLLSNNPPQITRNRSTSSTHNGAIMQIHAALRIKAWKETDRERERDLGRVEELIGQCGVPRLTGKEAG